MGQDTRNPSLNQPLSPQLKKLLAEPIEVAFARNAERCRAFGLTEEQISRHMGNVRSMVARLTIKLVSKDGHHVTEEGL